MTFFATGLLFGDTWPIGTKFPLEIRRHAVSHRYRCLQPVPSSHRRLPREGLRAAKVLEPAGAGEPTFDFFSATIDFLPTQSTAFRSLISRQIWRRPCQFGWRPA